MKVTCQILINKPIDSTHKPGGSVTGSVRYSVEEPTELKDIVLSLVGRGKCYWTERVHNVTIPYVGTEEYIAEKLSIFERNGQQTAVLLKGTHEQKFQFTIPEEIPPTFKNRTCSIVYRVCLKFEKPGLFASRKFNAPIDVSSYIKPLLHDNSPTLFGLEKQLLKPFSKKDNTIKLVAEVPQTIYTSGQNADISFTVTNGSTVTVPSVITELVCYTTYQANSGHKKRNVKYIKKSKAETPAVPANAIANMNSVISIPETICSIECKIMKKEYRLKVTLRLPVPYINASAEVPILIGEVQETFQKASNSGTYDEKAGPSTEPVGGDAPPEYWEVMNEEKEKDWF